MLEEIDIVHCRDCKSFIPQDGCRFFDNAFVDPDGFCAWGELKECRDQNASPENRYRTITVHLTASRDFFER